MLGDEGAGSVAEAGLSQNEVPILMATLGKALGVAGAFVAGSAALVDALVQSARTFIYTTAMPPALAAAARAAIDIARFEGWRRDRLARLITHFRGGAIANGFELMNSRTPIQPLVIGASGAGARDRGETRNRRILRSPRSGRRPCPTARHACASRRRIHSESDI